MQIDFNLLKKYDVPVPRYTSYPTVPFWKDSIDISEWTKLFQQQFIQNNKSTGISLYIHLPFCESLCTYCGCNKKITTNHSVEARYIEAIIREWEMYVTLMDEKPVIRELHLGGGTPTFFSSENLEMLLNRIFKDAHIHSAHEFGFEGHPNNTTKKHLQTLYNLGFRRVSYGVQDHDPQVQRIINRIQPFENVKLAVENARSVGYDSVNFDLIYGLPLQTEGSIQKTILQSISLKPDRVAFYSYAHVPWMSRGQRLFDENDLPSADEKMKLYQTGKILFAKNEYTDIGMDHFSLKTDSLYKAWNEGWLHRNFMGYTTQTTSILLGLGTSSISDIGIGFAQNHKTLQDYYRYIDKKELALTKGYFLDQQDQAFREYILNIACKATTTFERQHLPILEKYSFPELKKLAADKLIEFDRNGLVVTALGRNFIRNICKAFDLHLLKVGRIQNAKPTYSKAI
ncbi:oxygen-independent coproporphyrinogen III oxidase [Arachidicoccus sp.]|uniref:oxygen-independent coproporphyrinogen III oxidase n=1 Tax=Arachidicoccus sp. TaxID=1872624 RepID=UPI003D1B369B